MYMQVLNLRESLDGSADSVDGASFINVLYGRTEAVPVQLLAARADVPLSRPGQRGRHW